MSKFPTRRTFITAGLTTAAGAGLGAAAYLANRYGLIPPDHGGIYGAGETLTYATQRLLMSYHSRAREFGAICIHGETGRPAERRQRAERAWAEYLTMPDRIHEWGQQALAAE